MIYKNIVVKNGSYTDREGKEKGRYVTIGQVHKGDDGMYITLDAHVNLAAFPRKNGDTRVTASLYDPKERDEKPAPQKQSRATPDDGFDSDIPW